MALSARSVVRNLKVRLAKGVLFSLFVFGVSMMSEAYMLASKTDADYQKLEARHKLGYLLQRVNMTRYVPTPQGLPQIPDTGLFDGASLFSKSFLYRTFAHESDFFPENRKKLLHPMGSVGSFEFIADSSSPYTGLFQGAVGIARLSLAGNEEALGSYTPGMALKFLIDGQPSRNIQVMNRLEGQGSDRNFFSMPFSNVIPAPESATFKILEAAFRRVLDPANELPLGHLAEVTREGIGVGQPVAPFQIILQPGERVKQRVSDALNTLSGSDEDHRIQLSRIPQGETLYIVYARKARSSELERIGKIRLTSSLVPSLFGDGGLFFQHHW